jgi:BirA family biotin operon repressor/biotin-[acetyl-CoA-carboxylase] ligase
MNGFNLASLRAASLSLPCDLNWVFHEETGSTNTDAAKAAAEGAPHGTVVVANHQIEGRGRRGRVWQTGRGEGVCLSVVLRPSIPASEVSLLALTAAVAVAEVAGARFGIKWPNDVLDGEGLKVAGVLCEASFKGADVSHAVVGIGINVHGAPEGCGATSLDQTYSRAHDRVEIACSLVGSLLRWVDVLESDAEAVLRAWTERCVMWGTRVRVDGVEGVARGVDGRGALIVETEGGEQRVVAGEVGLIESPAAMKN